MDRAQREGSLAATFMLTPSISSSCCPAVFNPANDTVQVGHYGGTGPMLQYRRLSRVYTVQWFWTEHMAPRPHHNSAGSRLSQKYALNFGRSQIILHPSLPAAQCAMCFLCFLPNHCHLQPYWNLIQIEQINHKRRKCSVEILFHTTALKYVKPWTNIFLMASEKSD